MLVWILVISEARSQHWWGVLALSEVWITEIVMMRSISVKLAAKYFLSKQDDHFNSIYPNYLVR